MMAQIKVPNTDIVFGGDRVYVVAEIGKGFIQSEDGRPVAEYLENALALVDAAVASGVDAVKFQTHVLEDEQLPTEIKSPHFPTQDRFVWVKRNEDATPMDTFWKPLKAHCKKKGITFFSTPMSRMAALKLDELGDIPFWKIGSGDVQDYVLLNYLINTGKPIIISTGMVGLRELDEIVQYVNNRVPLIILYCVSQYPCPPEMFNLSTIEYFREKYPNLVIGFSDHSVDGCDVDLAAVKLGARMIEKHFTFDRKLWGSDHKASVLPHEMKAMVEDIRAGRAANIDAAAFYGEKTKELEGAKNVHRSYYNKALVAGHDIPTGTVITEDMVFAMRPIAHSEGLPANQLGYIVGKKALKDIGKYDALNDSVLA